jgi:hypothetical protein
MSCTLLENQGVVSSMEAANNARIILNVVSAATKAGRKDSDKIEGVADDLKQRHVPVYVGSDFSYGGLPVASAGIAILFTESALWTIRTFTITAVKDQFAN